jgi:hypothetical protein
MVFLVKANPRRPGEDSFRAEERSRKAALKTAIGLVGQGLEGVTITDENGRVFETADFAVFFREGS